MSSNRNDFYWHIVHITQSCTAICTPAAAAPNEEKRMCTQTVHFEVKACNFEYENLNGVHAGASSPDEGETFSPS